jgi:hypothetical protein
VAGEHGNRRTAHLALAGLVVVPLVVLLAQHWPW